MTVQALATAAVLWSSGFGFTDTGVPVIRVGISTGLDRALIESGTERVVARARAVAPARVHRVKIVERIVPPDAAKVEAALAAWRIRGHADARAVERGAAYAFEGEVVDTRQSLIVVKGGGTDALLRPPEATVSIGKEEAAAWRITGDRLRFDRRTYGGALIVAPDRHGRLAVINEIDAETLLRGVVPAETYPSAPKSALQAQAIAARNQLLAKLGARHAADPFHLCDETHCQVYEGADRQTPTTNAAVESTRGQALVRDGRLVDTVYSSSCGGFPAVPGHIFTTDPAPQGGATPILDRPPRRWCADAGRWRWRAEVAPMEVLDRSPDGRARAVRMGGRTVVGELAIRRALGGLPSALFVEDGPGTVHGGGHGHGAGMCQLGAIGQAKAGRGLRTILNSYYGADATLRRLW